jgi:TatD DNase family protein
MLLETDAPYLTPHPYRGKRNESAYIPIIAQKIAELKNISVAEVDRVTSENARTMFLIEN